MKWGFIVGHMKIAKCFIFDTVNRLKDMLNRSKQATIGGLGCFATPLATIGKTAPLHID